MLTHRSSALSLFRSLGRSLSRSKFDNFDLSHSYPSGARGEARRGTFSCGMLCVCTYVRSVRRVGVNLFVVVNLLRKPIRHCRRPPSSGLGQFASILRAFCENLQFPEEQPTRPCLSRSSVPQHIFRKNFRVNTRAGTNTLNR